MGLPILHCYADYKWTGPSEPVALLCRELSARGWPSHLACQAAPPGREPLLADRARAMGVKVLDEFAFAGGRHLLKHLRDGWRLQDTIAAGGYALVHCHGTRDHIIAAMALGRKRNVPLVRTDHRGRRFRPIWRRFYGPGTTDMLVVLSDRFAVQAVDSLRLAPDGVRVIRGAVDTEAFSPRPALESLRTVLGFAVDDFVIGLVARVQAHRRFGALMEAAEIVRGKNPRVKIAVLGRGTRKEELLDRPVRRRGLADTVFPLGYLQEGYKEALATFDAGMMLVPGTDGACRAALQMAAMAKPLVVAERGVLPDIVLDGRTGIVVKDMPDRLADAMLAMAAMPREKRAEWGEAGRRRVCAEFSLERQTDAIEDMYTTLLARGALSAGARAAAG